MPKLVIPTDHYPFVMVHMGMNDMAINSHASIKADYEVLGRKLKGTRAQQELKIRR